MVIVRLQGGLGNQLFQYALGKRLALKHKTVLKIDLRFLEQKPENPKYTLRDFELGSFNISGNVATQKEIETVQKKKPTLFDGLVSKITKKPIVYYRKSVIVEQSFAFDANILKSRKDCLLTGYWQSEKYFKEIEGVIRNEFAFKSEITDADNLKFKQLVEETDSVSVHFRRGDYVNNKGANQTHGLCSANYYAQAIEYVANKIENPVFFAFSDDIEWVKANIKFGYPIYFVDNNQEKQHEDFRLMSLCKHNIVTNSSFSWWAAWLNPNSKKTVIAPAKWFAIDLYDTKDLLPQSWIKL
jgi:hypothetical protein